MQETVQDPPRIGMAAQPGRRVAMRLAAGLCVVAFALVAFAHLGIGLADNFDFSREVEIYSPGPAGFGGRWLWPTDPEHPFRYACFYLPKWEFRLQPGTVHSSCHLLWFPGACLNWAFCSRAVLYVACVSLVARLVLVGLYACLTFTVAKRCAHPVLGLALLAAPFGLMMGTREYLAILNSFYQDVGLYVFLPAFVVALIAVRHRASPLRIAAALVSLLALSTAKAASIHWCLLGTAFLVAAVWRRAGASRTRWLGAAVFVVLSALLLGANLYMSDNANATTNAYNSLYYGVLRFSSHPERHLARLGLHGTRPLVGAHAHGQAGFDFLQTDPGRRLSHGLTVSVCLHEPRVVLASAAHVLANMQDISLDYLGRYPKEAPRSDGVESMDAPTRLRCHEHRAWLRPPDGLWNAWARLKFMCFPRGPVLAAVIVLFLGWFARSLPAARGFDADVAFAGLLTAVALPVDMAIAFLGNGTYELIKHLLPANLLFDTGAILFAFSVVSRAHAVLARSRRSGP